MSNNCLNSGSYSGDALSRETSAGRLTDTQIGGDRGVPWLSRSGSGNTSGTDGRDGGACGGWQRKPPPPTVWACGDGGASEGREGRVDGPASESCCASRTPRRGQHPGRRDLEPRSRHDRFPPAGDPQGRAWPRITRSRRRSRGARLRLDSRAADSTGRCTRGTRARAIGLPLGVHGDSAGARLTEPSSIEWPRVEPFSTGSSFILRTRAPHRRERTPFRTSASSCRCSSSGE